MKGIIAWGIFIVISLPFCKAQDSVLTRIVLIGDGGQFTYGKHPVSDAVKKFIPLDNKTVILYLGDNVYKVGLPDDQVITYGLARSVLDSQLSIVKNKEAKLYMIPGNHDWNNGGEHGFETVTREQYYVDLLARNNVQFYPKEGCPGPVEIALNDETILVIIDSQWWIHPYDKPGVESDCEYKTKSEVLTQLNDILTRNLKKLVIFAAHHAFRSNGIHGGYYGVKQHIFPFTDIQKNLYIPLPIIGSIYPISRGVFGSPQDLQYPLYANMIHDIEQVTRSHPNVIFVNGHEHNLQLIKDSGYYYLVSGSGSKSSRVSRSRKTLYASDKAGFATLEISKNKNVRASFYTVSDSVRKTYSENILNFSKLPKIEETATEKKPEAKFKDTVNAAAGKKYEKAKKFQRVVLGENYRKEWATSVNLKVFHIKEEKGGFKVEGMGGGKQTKSLKLEDKNGRKWTLRTIDKDPEKAIPENFRNSLASDIVQDLISASHPYAALSIPALAKAEGIVVPKPEFFFVPDDPALGSYRPMFANTVCLLELREPTLDGTEAKSTSKVLDKLVNDNDHRVDQQAVLKARLLDMLVADFDRHFDQWKWGITDTGKGKLYYPIPRDRDQAFFYSDGLLLQYVSQKRLPFLEGLRNNYRRINWLSYTARDFDRVFLNQLPAKTWEQTIVQFQQNISDNVIGQAVHQLPPEIFPIHGETIIKKLESRRNLILKAGMRYYRFLSEYVNIIGSNKPEYFKISSTDSGLKVSVYERINRMDTGFRLYERNFDKKITHELRLYGLNGNDLFEIDENASSPIRVRIIGGKGNDTFNIKGKVRNFLYDVDSSVNYRLHTSHSKIRFSKNPSVNNFNWTEYQYTLYRYPRLHFGYNPDDGLFLGLGFWRRTYGFRKDPYSTDNRFSALYAPNRGAYQLRYQGEYIDLFKYTDLIFSGELYHPTLNNFFGLGNNTMVDKTKNITYYYARFKYLEAEVLLRKKYFGKVSVFAGPYFYHYWNDQKDNMGKILEKPSQVSLDSAGVYTNKAWLGGKFGVDIDNLNNELFPTRGIHWTTEASVVSGLNGKSQALNKLQSDMVVFASLSFPARVVGVLRLGGGHIFSKNYEYYQALSLGANNFLRGFRKNRFSGSSLAYGSLEARIKLFESKWYVLPGSFGLVAFNDIGRVWLRNEISHRWHDAYGGGFYYVPFNMVIVSATVAFSGEEKLLNFSVGTKFNITF